MTVADLDFLAEDAIKQVQPFFDLLARDRVVKRHALHIVVAQRRPDGGYTVAHEESFGDVQQWEHPYNDIAHAKTRLSARTGLTAREVQELQSHLLQRGDVKWWGNAIAGDIIVSCSGVQPWYDEAIAQTTLALILAHHRQIVEELRGDSDDYFPE